MLCLLTITVYSAGPAASEASAADERNWIGSPLYHREIPKPKDGKGCIIELWMIAADPRLDFHSQDKLPTEVCAYHAEGFSYGIFSRMYTSIGLDNWTKESYMAVKKDGDDYARPVQDFGYNGSMPLPSLGKSTSLAVVSATPGYFTQATLAIIDDFLSKLTVDILSGYYRLLPNSYRENFNNEGGKELVINGYGASSNGKWLAVISKGQLMRINMQSGQTDIIAKHNFVESYLWPDPIYNLFINNDGNRLGYAGRTSDAVIFSISENCVTPDSSPTSYLDRRIYTRCLYRTIGPELDVHSEQIGPYSGGIRWYFYPSLLNNGTVLQYQDSHDLWHQISYENFSANKYMALGDSYASGEGDVDQFGGPHYLDGTNVWGDYKVGIPRENCHVSDHSYPFLLGAHAGLQQHFGMETVACSGAVQLNIAKRLDDFRPHAEYIAGVYMGQLTQRDGQDRPRLEGIPNATQLQQEALDKLLPGRVQQVEQLKRLQPYVATVQISGNDLNFAPIIQSCALNWPGTHKEQTTNPVPEDCDWSRSEFRAKVAAAILSNRADLVKLYRELKQASPNTQFYAVGYPLFVKQAMFCLNIPSFSPAEVEFITESIKFTNATIRSAASEAGFRYLNIEDALGDQVICGKDGAMTAPFDFVSAAAMADMKRGVTAEEVLTKYGITNPPTRAYLKRLFTDYERVRAINPKASPYLKFLEVTQELSHPNAEGHRLIANKVIDALGNESILTANCDGRVILCPGADASTIPSVPTYFGDKLSSTGMAVELVSIVFKTIQNGVEDVAKTGYDGGIWVVRQGSKLKITLTPRADIASGAKIVLHSNTYELGELSLESPGVYAAEITIPSSVPVGMHTVEIAGMTTSGSPYYSLMPVAIIGSPDDEDGDGIEDSIDRCLYRSVCMDASGENIVGQKDTQAADQARIVQAIAHAESSLFPTWDEGNCSRALCLKEPIDAEIGDSTLGAVGHPDKNGLRDVKVVYLVLLVGVILATLLLSALALRKRRSSTDK